MTDNRRFGTGASKVHSSRGERAGRRPAEAAADLASTDMSQEPSSRAEETQAEPRRAPWKRVGRAGRRGRAPIAGPAGRDPGPASAARCRVRQLSQARRPGAGRVERPGAGGAGDPPARRSGRHGSSHRRRGNASRRRRCARRRPWWTASCARSWRRRDWSESIRSASRSTPACTRRCPRFRRTTPDQDHVVSATFQTGLSLQGQPGAPRAGAGVLRPGPGLTWRLRTSTRSSAFPTRRVRTTSRRPTANWPSSTIPTPIPNNPATAERFKEISEAHAVLSDADKRKQYDQMRRLGRVRRHGPPAPGRVARRGSARDGSGSRGRQRVVRIRRLRRTGRHLLVDLRPGQARGAERRRDARGAGRGPVPDRRARREDPGHHPGHRSLPNLRRLGRRAGRDLVHLPRVQRPRDDLVRAGRVRGQPSMSPVPRPGTDSVPAVSDVPRRRRGAHRPQGRDHRARRPPTPAPGSASGQGAAGRGGRPPATSSSPSRSSPTGSSAATVSTSSARCRSTWCRPPWGPGFGCARWTARR